MTVQPFQPDAAPSDAAPSAQLAQPSFFAQVLDDVAAVLDGANRAENAYAAQTGSLQVAVYERARADVVLSVAAAAAQRAAQALQSVFNLQV
jgi:hypothetical protein